MIRHANRGDILRIAQILHANRHDPSLFQQTQAELETNLASFRVLEHEGDVVACACVRTVGGFEEIFGVAVDPDHQGLRFGTTLIAGVLTETTGEVVWLGTAKPDYFARFGFVRMSRWKLPLRVLIGKLVLVFGQPPRRWLPAIFGRHVFMRLPQSDQIPRAR